MKELYENAQMEIVDFSVEDVVSTSGITYPPPVTEEMDENENWGNTTWN